MARMFDVDALISKIRKAVARKGVSSTMAETMIRIAEKVPTVDAVEVVRCKDCKWRGTSGCIYHLKGAAEREDNDFCSDGERRSNPLPKGVS